MYLRNADGGVEYVHMQPQNNGEETGGVMLHPEGQYAHYYYVQDPMNAIPYGHDYPANEYNNNSGIDQGE
jgi:hypothetical protein